MRYFLNGYHPYMYTFVHVKSEVFLIYPISAYLLHVSLEFSDT